MNKLIFRHVDKDMQFSISSIPWDDQRIDTPGTQIGNGLPVTGPKDAGKILVVDQGGKQIFAHVDMNREPFRMRTHIVHGDLPLTSANMNKDPNSLNVRDGEMWIIQDSKSLKSSIWIGGTGLFGYDAGGVAITEDMLMEIEFDVSGIAFATDSESEVGVVNTKALNPANAAFLDIDGGGY